MARMIVTFFARIAKRGVRGKACPNCGGTNTVTHEDGWRSHCFDCGHTWK